MNVPVNLDALLLANHKDLPAELTNSLYVHRCTHSKTLSIHFYASIRKYFYFTDNHRDLPIHQAIALCLNIYIYIYPEISLPVYHDAFLLANPEDVPVDSSTPSMDIGAPFLQPTCSF